jgi:fibronectin-binding autotransporter adhesin
MKSQNLKIAQKILLPYHKYKQHVPYLFFQPYLNPLQFMKNRFSRTTIGLLSTITLSLTSVHAASGTWSATTGSPASWATASNWGGTANVGNTAGDVVTITANITGTTAYTISLNGNRTMGRLILGDVTDSSSAYTLAVGTPTTSALVFDQPGTGTAFLQTVGTGTGTTGGNTISALVSLNDTLRMYGNHNIATTMSGVISGSFGLEIDNDDGVTAAGPAMGISQFNFSAANTFSGGVTIDDARAAITNAAGFGTGTVTVNNGGGAWINASSLTIANSFNLSGTGWLEGNGYLGTIRIGSNTIFNGNITLSGTAGDSSGTAPDASLFPLAASSTAVAATVNGTVSGGDLLLGSLSVDTGATTWTGNETLTLNAANSYGDTIVKALDVPTTGQIALSVGGAITNTTATLGSGDVYLIGGKGGKIAALRIFRGNGYTLTQNIQTLTNGGTVNKTALIADVTGTGLTLNGKSVQVTEQVRLGGNANGTTLTIDSGSSVSADQFFTGNAANNSTTVNQTGGTVTVSSEVRVAHFATETSVWNMSGGTLTLTGTPTSNPYFTTGTNEDSIGKGTLYIGIDGQGTFQQTGGVVNAAAVVLDNRTNNISGTNMATGIDLYNLNGGTLNLGSPTSTWGIQGNASSQFVFGGGTLKVGASLPIAVAMSANDTGSVLDTNGFTVTLQSGIAGTGALALTDSTNTMGKVVFDLSSNATVTAALSGTRSVEKTGTGLLTLAGANTYNGATSVTAGGLRLTGSVTSDVTVDGAALWTGGAITGNLSVAPTTNGTVVYAGVPTAVTGNLTFGAASLNKVNPVGNGVPANGTYPLITFTGALTGGLGNLQIDPAIVPLYRQTFGLTASANSIDLTVSGASLSLVWNGVGAGAGTWDVASSTTWASGEKFFASDTVTFNDSAASAALGNASFTTNLTNSLDNDLVFSAKTAGVGGEAVSIRYVVPTEVEQPLSVDVTGSAITVNLATDAGGFVITVASEVKAAIEGNAAANALVSVVDAGADNGTGFVAALPQTFLDLATVEMVVIPTDVIVSPTAMTFANNALDYQIDGPGSISGSGGLLKSGTARVTINSTNSYSGNTVIAKGVLVAGATNALGTGGIIFGDATTLAADTCTLSLATGPLSLANPTIAVADTCLNARIISTGGTINNTTITKKGAGKLTIGHPTVTSTITNYITGTSSVLVEQGNIAFSSMSAMANNTPVTLGNSNSGSVNTVLEMPVNGTATGDATTLTAAITLGTLGVGDTSQAILRYVGSGASGASASLAGTINLNGRDLYLENTSHITGIPPLGTAARLCNYTARISGAGDVHVRCGTNIDGTFNATPRCRITNASNDWVGDLYVDTGMVQIGNGSATGALTAIPNTSVIRLSAGTRLGLGGASETVAGLVGGVASGSLPAAIINNNTGGGGLSTLTLSGSGDYVYDGTIADENATRGFVIVKSGSGTQTFNGPGTYTGINNGATPTVATVSMNITGGTVAVGHDTALGAGAVNLNSATGTLRSADANARTLANPVTYSTNFTLGSPTTGNLLFTGPVNVGSGAKDFKILNAVTEFSGIISGGGTLIRSKSGPGTLIFSGANTYPGSTAVNEGTLLVNNASGSGTGTTAVTVAEAATLGGSGTISGAVTTSGPTAKIAPGNSTGALTIGSLDLSAGGSVAIEIDDASTPKNDKLVITGTAANSLNVTGATLNISVTGTPTQSVYVLASCPTGALTGTFATVTGMPADYVLVYNYNDGVSANNIALVDKYMGWLGGYPVITGANRSPDVDYDNDGLDNGIEFMIGADPTVSTGAATPGYPVGTPSAGNFVYSFKRSAASKIYPVTVETSVDLVNWPLAKAYLIPTVDGTTGDVTVSGETVTVTIPMAPDARKFVRVSAAIPFNP